MKFYPFIFLFFINTTCNAQQWLAEIMAGTASYNGDLTEKEVPPNAWGLLHALILNIIREIL